MIFYFGLVLSRHKSRRYLLFHLDLTEMKKEYYIVKYGLISSLS